ncbi:hypothetical protein GCM10009827_119550 [Dactylosporangium maewongense]|uniref:Transposase n=1 Tax=Dactylosporangium maewongense TaxID=634393 RepID=A0ABP4PG45_9ACTN
MLHVIDDAVATLAEGRRRVPGAAPPPAWQAVDTRELVALLDAVAVPRPGGVGRHRKRLDHLTADKAYGSKANRRSLRARGIPHTIPERADVRASRAARDHGAAGPRTSMQHSTKIATGSNGHSTGSNSSGLSRLGTTS